MKMRKHLQVIYFFLETLSCILEEAAAPEAEAVEEAAPEEAPEAGEEAPAEEAAAAEEAPAEEAPKEVTEEG